MHLVFLALEPAEEAADAVVGAVAFDDERPFLVGEIRPRHVEPDGRLARRALQLRQLRAVMRLAPRLDGALVDRLRSIGHHQVHVELDDVAEAVARRAGAERVVEREEARLRRLVRDAARAALEALGELDPDGIRDSGSGIREHHRERRAAAFAIRRLDRIREAGPQIAFDAQPIDDHVERGLVLERGAIDVVERHRAAVDQHAAVARGAGGRRASRQSDRSRCAPAGQPTRLRVLAVEELVGRLGVAARVLGGRRRHADDGDLEPDHHAGIDRQLGKPLRDDLRRLADHFLAALPAERPADARVQQPHVVVDFGGRADRRARVADAVLLPDGDGGTDAFDLVDVGLFHPLEELPRVGGQRFDVAALPFGVDRVEGERRLARSADAGEDDQLAVRQRDVDVLQVVRARAAHDERTAGRVSGVGHPTVENFRVTVREEWYYRGSATASAVVFRTTETANADSKPAIAARPPTSNSRTVSGPSATRGS